MAKEKQIRSARKNKGYLPDGDGGTLAPPSILAIDEAAELARKQKGKVKKAGEELVALAVVMEKHRDAIPGGEYIYEDAANVRRVVRWGKASIKMGKVKKAKASTKADAHGIVSGASAAETEL